MTNQEKYNEWQMEAMKSKPKFSDYENPAFLFSTIATELLTKIAQGEIDPVWLAKRELANRGCDLGGRWVGNQIAEQRNFK
jgi:hypothetical protein